MKVLIVDDDYAFRKAFARVFDYYGYYSIESASAKQGILALETNPDIVLVMANLRMEGEESGLELLRHAQQMKPSMKLCLTSAAMTSEAEREAVSMGALVLEKPFGITELLVGLRLMGFEI